MNDQIVVEPEIAEGVVYGVRNEALARRRRFMLRVHLGRALLVLAVLGGWQYFGPRIGEMVASSPLQVVAALRELARSGALAGG